MSKLIVKKTNFLYVLSIFIIFYLSISVANKAPGVDPDYYVYYNGFYFSESKEVTFNLISSSLKSFGFDIKYLFFIYCFLSLLFKFRLLFSFYLKNSLFTFFFIIICYFFCFFPIWEFTQIRGSLAIGILMYSIYCIKDKKYQLLGILIAIFFHNSMLILASLYFSSKIFYIRKYISILLLILIIIISKKVIGLTAYSVYSQANWGDEFKITSFKNFYILLTNIFVFFINYRFYKNDQYYQFRNVMFLFNIAFFILCIYVGIFYGSISIRYADILLFSTILLLGTLYRNIYANLFQLFTIVIVCPYYFHYFFYSDRALFKLDSFLKVFL
ncbi:EpsG family protein [Acinetobacter ursingii]|uniref:EpsG family protein n=1 Tax=Acinetobacter ursingii TaxID=108980 RepID=UPI000F7819E7|nr:EpsG family protein [Acinetobacter ursingii]